jgi:Arc/MetJ family transcription regulator
MIARTKVEIDAGLLLNVKRDVGTGSNVRAVDAVLREFVERNAHRRLVALHGAIPQIAETLRRRT